MTRSIILDLETLALTPESAITEIGVLAFSVPDFQPLDSITLRPNILDQLAAFRHCDPDTIAYLKEKDALPTLIGDLAPKEAIHTLTRFIESINPRHIWIQGPDFDRPILENFCRQYDMPLPWDYWRMRDSRTIWATAFPGVRHPKRPHTALADCDATLTDLHASLKELNRLHTA